MPASAQSQQSNGLQSQLAPVNWSADSPGVVNGANGSFVSGNSGVMPAGTQASSSGGLPAGWTTQKGYYIPQYSAYQNLSPAEQKIFDATEAAKANLGNIAKQQSAFLQDYLGHPADLSNEAVSQKLFDLGRKRLDPMFATQRDQMSADLANKGIMIGSKAYDTAQQQQGQNENDAFNQLILNGQNQAFQQAVAQRNQPINEITALLSGSQVTNPNFVNPNMPTIPTTDYAGIVNQNYNQQLGLADFQQRNAAQQNALLGNVMGGLFGLGAAGIMRSDRRTKTDIRKVGKLDNGLDVYVFRYIEGGPTMMGLMAQEVEKANPDAVVEINDIKYVNYDKAVL